jgi:hypothetical protein
MKLTPLRLLLELSGLVHVKLEFPERGPGSSNIIKLFQEKIRHTLKYRVHLYGSVRGVHHKPRLDLCTKKLRWRWMEWGELYGQDSQWNQQLEIIMG